MFPYYFKSLVITYINGSCWMRVRTMACPCAVSHTIKLAANDLKEYFLAPLYQLLSLQAMVVGILLRTFCLLSIQKKSFSSGANKASRSGCVLPSIFQISNSHNFRFCSCYSGWKISRNFVLCEKKKRFFSTCPQNILLDSHCCVADNLRNLQNLNRAVLES